MILPGEEVAKLLESVAKVNPAGVDVAPKKVFRLPEEAVAVLDGKRRGFLIEGKFVPLVEALEEVKPRNEFWVLDPGRYYVVFPKIKIPPDCVAFAYPRSTLNRLGIIKSQTAVFDPGYEGEWNQTFWFPLPAKIRVTEGWVQVVVFKESVFGSVYSGHWQGEKY